MRVAIFSALQSRIDRADPIVGFVWLAVTGVVLFIMLATLIPPPTNPVREITCFTGTGAIYFQGSGQIIFAGSSWQVTDPKTKRVTMVTGVCVVSDLPEKP